MPMRKRKVMNQYLPAVKDVPFNNKLNMKRYPELIMYININKNTPCSTDPHLLSISHFLYRRHLMMDLKMEYRFHLDDQGYLTLIPTSSKTLIE